MCQWLSEGIWGLPLGAIAVVEAQIWANKNGVGIQIKNRGLDLGGTARVVLRDVNCGP